MSRGHLAVIAVRALLLEQELRHAIRRSRMLGIPFGFVPTYAAPFYRQAGAVRWEAQRLQSAIDKALTGRPRDPETGLR